MGGSSYAGDYDSAACLRWLLGLAHKMAQLSCVLLKNRHVSNQDSQAVRRSHYLICISMHKLHLICLNMNRQI